MHGIYILRRLTAVGEYERVIVFSLEVKLERVCLPTKGKCEKEKECLKTKYLSKIRVLESAPKKKKKKKKNMERNSNEDGV